MELIHNTKTEMTPHKKFLVVEDDIIIQPLWDRIIRAIGPNAIIRWSTSEEGAESISHRKFTQMVEGSENRFPYLVQKPLDTVECLESLRAMMAYKRAFSIGGNW